jgi:branched-chain amino acid transport system ATP-binding protein
MLKIQDLYSGYGNITVLKGLSFEVPQGKVVCLIGSNGAGKTTTLKTVMGLLKVQSGKMELEGINLNDISTATIVRHGIAYVPEGRRIFPEMTVQENLKIGAYSCLEKRGVEADIDLMLHRFPLLARRVNQRAGNLSGGEQQMLAIARALMSHPRLLLLDEPSMGLGPLLVKQVFELVKEINRDGATILLVEQNARMALEIASEGYLLETGRGVMHGPSEVLLNDERVKKVYLGE